MPDYEKAARKAAKKYGVDPDIYVAQLRQESGLKMGLKSPAGAQDIAQFMPGTAKSYGVTLGDGRAADDLDGGARYMRDNLKQFGGDYSKALAAYNAGAGAVQKYGGIPPYAETRNYVKTILGNAGKGSAPKLKKTPTTKTPAIAPAQTTTTTPGVDNSGLRRQLVGQFLQQGGVANPNAVLTLAGSYGQAADTPGTTSTVPAAQPSTSTSPSLTPKLRSGLIPLGGSKNAGKGAFDIDGPNPARLQSGLTSFAKKVAEVYGGPLVGKDGSTHSKFTTSGNVSEHYTGNATDIFQIGGKPAQGKRLLKAGRAALIAAGMPRAEALKAQGGLYNVGAHQIIFLTNEGGNHFDHLHISTHAG